MKLGNVIGRVTLSKTMPPLIGARWLIVSPFTREHEQHGAGQTPGPGKEPSLIVYDDPGVASGETIGYVEGREAASPCVAATPIVDINAAPADDVYYDASV